MKEFCFSGTLGDAFIVLCKLHNYCRITGDDVILKRYSKHISLDNVIGDLFSLDSNIHYLKPCIKSFHPLIDIRHEKAQYINICWDGREYNELPPDPDKIKMDPYPELDISQLLKNSTNCNTFEQFNTDRKIKIGIQLHSGKLPTNFKGFSLKWIEDIRKALPNEYEIFLFGTGEGYSLSKIDRLCSKRELISFVGKTGFSEWLFCLKSLDFLITYEGFAAFFSMSQRIPTLAFYSSPESLCRVHPKWKRFNTLVDSGNASLIQRIMGKIQARSTTYSFYEPLKPEYIWPIIEHDVFALK